MIDEQFLQTIPRYGIGGFVGKIFKNVKKAVQGIAEPAGAALGFMIGGPAGASIGAGIGSLIAGKKPERALKSALMAYGIGNLAGSGFFGKTIQGFGGKGIPTFGLTDGNLFSGIGSKGQILPTDLASNLFGSSDKLVAEKDLSFEAWAKSNNIDLTNPNLNLDLGYTYLRVNDINNTDPILYRPNHKLVSSIKYKSNKISHIISMRFQSEQDYQDFLSDEREYEGSEIKFPIEQLKPLTLFNYVGSYELTNSDKISLKISNLFDKQYELIQDFPMPGRTISLMYDKTF